MTNEDVFRTRYVTAGEVQKRVRVSRAAISNAVKLGKFPKPLDLDEVISIWNREDVEQAIRDWAKAVETRRK
ncbi:hypothetical protein PQD73_gp098 [Stenotrophomonas phage Salva]|uniref:AlpA family phage regulatory protein n=1 Tax=Stenotrophomonas phage Salva TaxID=2801524 RepID=A0A8B6Q886_9CAUD|nr:hypothetical protein PQD73_gp098 [Stenotrophomonas phage Salva]QQM18241.1 hypothetical protein CPT_Salva_078 [Stenotrophomonas phage Salva]